MYRLDLRDNPTNNIYAKIWTESFWVALKYLLEQVPSISDNPTMPNKALATKLYRGRKLLAEIKCRKGWYPYYLKVYPGLTKDEYSVINRLIVWNELHNTFIMDRYQGTTKIKDWHGYLINEGIVYAN